ncbi:MAG: sugar-binding domain-containing protein [Terracidiphilus sp.]
MDRRAFLEGLCASVAAAGLKSSSSAEAPTLLSGSFPGPNVEVRSTGPSAPSTTSTSLAGEWRIRLDQADTGIGDQWFHSANGFADRIPLPGSTDEHHFGRRNEEIAPQHLTRMYDFTGPAWYERDITIPESWQGKRVVLFLERCHWETRAWLDDYPLGAKNSLSTPHVYELGIVGKPPFNRRSSELSPGTRRLTVRVDNRTTIDVGPSSATTAEVGATWNGIIGRMELQVTDLIWIDRLSVYPHRQEKRAHVKLSMRNLTGKKSSGKLEVAGGIKDRDGSGFKATADVVISEMPVSAIEHDVDLGAAPPTWDEFSSAIFQLAVSLSSTSGETNFASEANTTFGLREISASGKQLRLNGNPIVLRGTVDNGIFPLTGYDPMDIEFWRERLRIYRDYGLNHVRFHSWCPPDAAFTAADELGILFQVANPMWIGDGRVSADEERTEFIRDEAHRIVDTYGNHPSFTLMSMGNEEGSGQDPFLGELVRGLQDRDPRHLYTSTSAPDNILRPDNYFVSAGPRWTNLRGDPRFENDAPNTSTDYETYIRQAEIDRPLIAHEVGQWTVFPNFEERKDYIGPLQPRYFDLYRDALTRTGLMGQAERFRQASGQLTVALYKEEIESLLRTPDVAGFQLLGLTDFPGFGPAFVGVLDTLSKSKGLITPDEFRRFCGPTVPLLRLDKRLWSTDETLVAQLDLARYGPGAFRNADTSWTVRKTTGAVQASGTLPAVTVESGGLTQLGTLKIPLADFPSAAQFSIECSVGDSANAWDIWVYPKRLSVSAKGITVASNWDASTRAALHDGKTVVLFPDSKGFENTVPCSFTTVFWAAAWFPERHETMGVLCDPQHPSLKLFPTSFHSDWQWWELTSKSHAFDLTSAPAGLAPIVQIIDDAAKSRRLGAIIEARVGRGKLLATSFDLVSNPQNRLAARQLRASLLSYAVSPEFDPKNELQLEYLDSLFKSA